MTRLCLIGNSHLAAFRRGWMALPERPAGMTATFFGSLRDTLKHLEPNEGKLVAADAKLAENIAFTSGGLTEIDPAAYDVIILIGLYVSMKRTKRFYRNHRYFGQSLGPSATLIRRALAVETLVAEFSRTRMVELAQTLRLLTDKPILAFAEPYWASRSRGDGERAGPDSAEVAALYRETVAAALRPHGVTFIPQPASTIEHYVQTFDRFNVPDPDKPPKVGPGDDSEDYAHMNTAYGLECWRELLPRLPV